MLFLTHDLFSFLGQRTDDCVDTWTSTEFSPPRERRHYEYSEWSLMILQRVKSTRSIRKRYL